MVCIVVLWIVIGCYFCMKMGVLVIGLVVGGWCRVCICKKIVGL